MQSQKPSITIWVGKFTNTFNEREIVCQNFRCYKDIVSGSENQNNCDLDKEVLEVNKNERKAYYYGMEMYIGIRC